MISSHLAYGIIPARYASTRFPGKPLADILGKPMFWHVWERAKNCPAIHGVTLATDDERILEEARRLNVPAVMTRADHASGTDRVYEAAGKLDIPDNAIVVNIQGDEPALDPEALNSLIRTFDTPEVVAATLAHTISAEEALRPDKVKVVLAANGDALYFSRSPIPYVREGHARPYLGHIGLYAFRMGTLRQFVSLAPSKLELTEKLEQLRLLENGIPLRVVLVENGARGVDTPEDLKEVLRILEKS